MNTLVIGGTSGLGLEIARDFRSEGDKVWVTGRRAFKESGLTYIRLDLAGPELPKRIREFVVSLPKINSLIYAAGFFQDGRVTDLSTRQIEDMLDVCGRGLIYLMKEILDKQGNLDELVTITSTSQWTPRQREPIYNFVKSGVAHFSNAMAEDGRVGRVLVAGPSGMRTSFWEGIDRGDLDTMLDPSWVSKEVMKLREGDYKYRFARILRQPSRIEIGETR